MPIDLCREEIDIHLRFRGVYQHGNVGANDSFAVVYIYNQRTTQYEKLGTTEVIYNSNSPEFITKIRVVYLFETRQKLKIVNYFSHQVQEDTTDLTVLGETNEFLLSDLVQNSLHLNLKLRRPNGHSIGEVNVSGISLCDIRDVFQFNLEAIIDSHGRLLSTPRPFFVISRVNERGEWIKVVSHRDVRIGATLEPHWGTLKVATQKLCNGDLHCPLTFQLYDYKSEGHAELIGEIKEICLQTILEIGNTGELPIAMFIPGKSEATGTITFRCPELIQPLLFSQYLQKVKLSLELGIDFSRSNIDPSPRNPEHQKSLHYIHPTDEYHYNIYQDCLQAVGHIVLQYDDDKCVPIYGFGAKVMNPARGAFGPTDHCFPLAKDEVYGVEGALTAYKECFQFIQLAGPTLLEPIIKKGLEGARRRAEMNKFTYTILLIITDGDIQDMNEATNAIIEASSAPLSIIIMGVGNGNFKNMEILDSDGTLLTNGTRQATRDIVQFVKYEPEMHVTELAEQVLQEIPQQVMDYFDGLQQQYPDLFK